MFIIFLLQPQLEVNRTLKNLRLNRPQSSQLKFRQEFQNHQWKLFPYKNQYHQQLCDLCLKLNDGVQFNHNLDTTIRSVCSECLYDCCPSIGELTNHINDLLMTQNLTLIPSTNVQIAIEFHFCSRLKSDQYQQLCHETNLSDHNRSNLLFEDWIQINVNLLKLIKVDLQSYLNQLNLPKCKCGRYYDPTINIRYCQQCHYILRLPNTDFHLVSAKRLSFINPTKLSRNYRNRFIYYQSHAIECLICYELHHNQFRFGCGHLICQECFLNLSCRPVDKSFIYNSIDDSVVGRMIRCPYCRDPYLVPSEEFYFQQLRLEYMLYLELLQYCNHS